jgi:hypothetical protein
VNEQRIQVSGDGDISDSQNVVNTMVTEAVQLSDRSGQPSQSEELGIAGNFSDYPSASAAWQEISASSEKTCPSVSTRDFYAYLLLALDEKFKHDEARGRFFATQLQREISPDGQVSENVAKQSNVMEPKEILGILAKYQIDLQHWEKVTQTAGIQDLLLAGRRVRAVELGLPEHASQEQINNAESQINAERSIAQQITRGGVVQAVLNTLRDCREGAAKGESRRLNMDNSIELGTHTMTLDQWHVKHISKVDSTSNLYTFAVGALAYGLVVLNAYMAWRLFPPSVTDPVEGSPCSIIVRSYVNTSVYSVGLSIPVIAATMLCLHMYLSARAIRQYFSKVAASPIVQETLRELPPEVQWEPVVESRNLPEKTMTMRFYLPPRPY